MSTNYYSIYSKLSWILLVLLPSMVNAQTVLSGWVMNSDGEALKFARVVIRSKDSDRLIGYTFTNDVGEYNVEMPNKATLLITFSATYYFSETYPISTSPVQDIYTLNAKLQPKPEKLKPVLFIGIVILFK